MKTEESALKPSLYVSLDEIEIAILCTLLYELKLIFQKRTCFRFVLHVNDMYMYAYIRILLTTSKTLNVIGYR
jgi:hypothetical protein